MADRPPRDFPRQKSAVDNVVNTLNVDVKDVGLADDKSRVGNNSLNESTLNKHISQADNVSRASTEEQFLTVLNASTAHLSNNDVSSKQSTSALIASNAHLLNEDISYKKHSVLVLNSSASHLLKNGVSSDEQSSTVLNPSNILLSKENLSSEKQSATVLTNNSPIDSNILGGALDHHTITNGAAGEGISSSQLNGAKTEVAPERMGLFKRFHHTYKQYGKVLVVVHCITSSVWTAIFYYAAMRYSRISKYFL